MRRLLLLSNSRDSDGRYLFHAADAIARRLQGVRQALFVPFADVSGEFDAYTDRVQNAMTGCDIQLDSLHACSNATRAVERAEAIVVGGGNTFRLLAELQARQLLVPMRARILAGTPYVGWSAGSIISCPTLGTTNDMPIVEPASFDALGVVAFQINAHFTDAHPPGFQGETRRQRLQEFLMANPGRRVVGLPEGTWLEVDGDDIRFGGTCRAPLFRHGTDVLDLEPDTLVHELLEPQGR